MSGELSEYAYGKIKIRVMKVNRHGEGTAGEKHDVHELTVKTLLYGDFADAWTVGSNSKIIATETQKNTVLQRAHAINCSIPYGVLFCVKNFVMNQIPNQVYQLARTSKCSSPEDFGKLIAAHFLNSYNWVKKAQITLWEDPWARIEVFLWVNIMHD
jgi:urate oxidase